jgi:TIR domain
MKVFISWSGDRSKAVAEALRDWIPKVIQAVNPWISSRDIPKGARWSQHIAAQLEGAKMGVICLTPENLSAPWILFEAGAMAKTLEETFVCTFLLGIKPSDVRDPLAQFQATKADENDTRMMLQTINTALGESHLSEKQFDSTYEKWWPDLEKALKKIPVVHSPSAARRSTDDMLEEALGLLRGLARAVDFPVSSQFSVSPERYLDLLQLENRRLRSLINEKRKMQEPQAQDESKKDTKEDHSKKKK